MVCFRLLLFFVGSLAASPNTPTPTTTTTTTTSTPPHRGSPCSPNFVFLESQWCILFNITAPVTGIPPPKPNGKPLTWPEAKSSCGMDSCDGYLVILEDKDVHGKDIDALKKLQAISKYINKNFPDETKTGLVLWVGAQGLGNRWKWDNFNDVNLQSNIWAANQPSRASSGIKQYGRLAPADSTHGRRYLVSDTSDGISPAYICEEPILLKK